MRPSNRHHMAVSIVIRIPIRIPTPSQIQFIVFPPSIFYIYKERARVLHTSSRFSVILNPLCDHQRSNADKYRSNNRHHSINPHPFSLDSHNSNCFYREKEKPVLGFYLKKMSYPFSIIFSLNSLEISSFVFDGRLLISRLIKDPKESPICSVVNFFTARYVKHFVSDLLSYAFQKILMKIIRSFICSGLHHSNLHLKHHPFFNNSLNWLPNRSIFLRYLHNGRRSP